MTAALSDPPAAASAEEFDRAEARTAHNYHPLPVVHRRRRGRLGDRRRRPSLPRPAWPATRR